MKEKFKNKFGLVFIIFVVVIVIGIPFATVYALSDGHPYSMYVVRKEASEHLKDMGYTNEDIYEARYVVNDTGDTYYDGCYSVIFKDEPDITYYYGVSKDHKEVCQFAEKDEELDDGSYTTNFGQCQHSESKVNHH